MKRLILLPIVLLLVFSAVVPGFAQGNDQDYSGRAEAPAFPQGLDWLNTPAPLTWEALRGKVVLLDFWTYGCINCIHIIPDLKRLEQEYADELVVIGVHSAKFTNESDTENIRQIVQRYGIEHPVVNDSAFEIWQTWGVRAWPTVMLVDPQGMVFGYHAGEGVYEVLEPIIAGMVRQFDAQGAISRTPIPLALEAAERPESLLAFPGKVLADADGGRLFIADSSHHRIVVADLYSYEVLQVVGGMDAGLMDGSFAVARFNTPQGMALSADGQTLYVADTGNHAVRAVDLQAETVQTVAGTGQQAAYAAHGGNGTGAALSSPWDLTRVDGMLYIAMAGPHQLWRFDLVTGEVSVHSGSGREGLADAPHARAALAQPSGITTDGERLYFADSEASAIRAADVNPDGSVSTIVGTGLFDFGDQDGVGDAALLQHPLGVVFVDGKLFVADTYNNKVKAIDPVSREVVSVAGGIEGGYQDGPLADALFDEPGGISYAAGNLYVADTNNHVIRVVSLEQGLVESIRFSNPEMLQGNRTFVVAVEAYSGDEIVLGVREAASGQGEVALEVRLPPGYKINDLAQSSVVWHLDGSAVQSDIQPGAMSITDDGRSVNLPVVFSTGDGAIAADLTIFYCESVNESLCFVERTRLTLPMIVTDGADTTQIALTHTISPPIIEQR